MSYHAALRRAEKFYKTLMSTQSSHFNDGWVVFNNIGFRHLIRKAKVRTRKEQMKRFALLYEAPEVLRDPNATVVSYRIDENKNLPVQYWAIQREKNGAKIKVIVRQVGNGKKHFYSVMDVP
jgi:hypothetical protein